MHEALQQFHPVIGTWFEERVGVPTPPQVMGWPRIAAEESTLILAPTGSGKTLAAFLSAIDRLAKELIEEGGGDEGEQGGVRILYISPLKALANDVQKNLIRPLEEMAQVARRMREEGWPEIMVGVRTGDTPGRERAAMVRHPPHLLITTPESLHLLLTSSARRILRTVQYLIVDEVHALAGTKRGVFLSVLLERLEHERRAGQQKKTKVAPGVYMDNPAVPPLVRIGLSATVRPAERVAAWLAGYETECETTEDTETTENDGRNHPNTASSVFSVPSVVDACPPGRRPIQIVDTGQRKRLDLAVQCPWGEGGGEAGPGVLGGDRSNWPSVVRLLLQLIREHRSTLVFANSRRLVERLLGMMAEQGERGGGMGSKDVGELLERVQPHHGSIAKGVRLATEQALKSGELRAVVATSSLELGIDIGSLDLVCQVESPGNVAAALQRVGRAGHLEKATAKGRMIPKSVPDLGQFAALVPLMLAGEVEETTIPTNCLDVLAQQIVAACAVEPWDRKALLALFRRSANYRTLAEAQFDSVVEMLAASSHGQLTTDHGHGLKARISFDRVNDRLIGLPASSRLAIMNGGVIADTGQYPVYIADNPVRIGELDEEFVFESKVGDRIVLGSQSWQIEHIDVDRVLVSPAAVTGGGTGRMPFWRGESAPRSVLLGEAAGRMHRELEAKLAEGDEVCRAWLIHECRLDDAGADELIGLHARQKAFGSAMPTDARVVVEHFRDRTGEPMVAILTPLGSRVHHALRLALEARFADRRVPAQIIHHDDGLLIRPSGEAPLPDDPLSFLTAELLEPLIVDALEQSALFGLRFRQNAARALMLPRASIKRRTPLWQQRLRAKNLLAVVKQQRNFPIVVETYRECLQDVLHVERARQLLADIETGNVEVAVCQTMSPSPMVRALWQNFEQIFMYEWDEPVGAATQQGPTVDTRVLDAILERKGAQALTAEARGAAWTEDEVAALERRITGAEFPARTPEELLEKIAAAGPVALGPPSDPQWAEWAIDDPAPMLERLMADGRLVLLGWPGEDGARLGVGHGVRWMATESLGLCLCAMGKRPPLYSYQGERLEPASYERIPPALLACSLTETEARRRLIEIEVRRTALTDAAWLQERFGFMREEVPGIVGRLVEAGMLVEVPERPGRLALPEHLDQLRSLALRRQRRAVATAGLKELQQHLIEWHHIAKPVEGRDGLEDVLDALSPLALPLSVWEHDVLPVRVAGFTPHLLDQACADGHWVPVGCGEQGMGFVPRHLLGQRPGREGEAAPSLAGARVLDFLRDHGASYGVDLELELLETAESLAPTLRDLFLAGLISNDRLESLHAVLAFGGAGGADKPMVDTGRYPAGMLGRGGTTHRDVRAQRRARLKVGGGAGGWRSVDRGSLGGRWFVLPPRSQPGDALAIADVAVERTERLLRRHGFACRELHEPAADGPWRDAYDVLTRMEWAGQVRRGYFVDRISGAQFAVPGITLAPRPPGTSPPVHWLAMLDPANLYARLPTHWTDAAGGAVRVPRVQGSWLAIVEGVPVLAAVSWGVALSPLSESWEAVQAALRQAPALLERLPREQRHFLHVKRWGEGDALGSPAETVLRSVGFERDTQGLRLYRQYHVAEPPPDGTPEAGLQ